MPRKNKEEEKFPYITGPSRLRDSSPGIRLVSHVSHRDILWKTGDLVSVIEEEVRYFAQVCSIFIVKDCDWSIQTMRAKYFEPWIWWVRLDPCDCAVPSESSGMFGSVAPSRRRRQVASGSGRRDADRPCLSNSRGFTTRIPRKARRRALQRLPVVAAEGRRPKMTSLLPLLS